MRARPSPQPAVAAGVLAVACALALPGPAAAQKSPGPLVANPQLYLVTPCGGQVGTTVEVTLTGVGLEGAQGLLFSHPGIRAASANGPASATPRRGAARPAAAAVPKFKVAIGPDVPPGTHDVRVVGPGGVSNPRAFVVGDLAEVHEREPNNDVSQAQRVPLNCTVTGTVAAPTDVDYFLFPGQKGQRVVVSCLTWSIDSRLEAAVELYDDAGKLLGFNTHYHEREALLDCTLPHDGDYQVRLFGFTYTQGSAEHFYRLSISTAPWIDAVFPPVVEPGKPAILTVYGRNLPGGKPDPAAVVDGRVLEAATVRVDVPGDPVARQRLAYSGRVPPVASGLDGFEYRVRNAAGISNPFLLAFARAPVVLDNGANDTPDQAQEVTPPCEVAGRIEKTRDRDWYAFTAKKGEVYSVEAQADRLGSPVDLYLELRRGGQGGALVELDDDLESLGLGQFMTRSEDPPRYRFTAPADGRYLLLVSSREAAVEAGPRDYYRLRITPERPDFRLIVMPPSNTAPDACVLRAGGRQVYTVFVWRQDGYDGPIALSAEGLPDKVRCPPQTVGAGVRQAALVLSAETDAKPWTGAIVVRGTAAVAGEELVREARPATITWPVLQPNIPAFTRLDRSLVLAVRDGPPAFTLDATLDRARVNPGQRVSLRVKVKRPRADFKGPVFLTVGNAPPGLIFNNNQRVQVPPNKDDAVLTADVRGNVAPGVYALVVRGSAPLHGGAVRRARAMTGSLVSESAAPTALAVVPRQLARVALAPATVALKPGGEAVVTVRVARMYNFDGPFEVRVTAPRGANGVHASEATIPAGQNEGKLVVKADEDAAAGARPTFAVQVVGRFQGTEPVSQEVRLAVRVGK